MDWQAVTANGLLVDKQGGKEERSRHLCVRVRSQTFYPPISFTLKSFPNNVGELFPYKAFNKA